MTEVKTGEPAIEVVLEVDYGTFKAAVRGVLAENCDIKALTTALSRALQVVENSKPEIDKLMAEKGRLKPSIPGLKPVIQRPQSEGEVVLPSKGKAGILEFAENDVRYPPTTFKELGFPEAIALLLYEVDSPMMPSQITKLINRGFKPIDPKNVSSCLSNRTRYKLPNYVIREKDGWRLTGSGRAWVESDVLAKLTARVGGT